MGAPKRKRMEWLRKIDDIFLLEFEQLGFVGRLLIAMTMKASTRAKFNLRCFVLMSCSSFAQLLYCLLFSRDGINQVALEVFGCLFSVFITW